MKLKDIVCKMAKPRNKPYKLMDGSGLYLFVQPNGRRYWRMRYIYLGKDKTLSFGVYPSVTLAEAREKRERAKKLLAGGKDPATVKKEEKQAAIYRAANTFEAVAREWHEKQRDIWTERHALKIMRRLEVNAFPYIGSRPLDAIDAPELLDHVLRRIEQRGTLAVAAQVRQACGQVFRYGIATGRCQRDPAADLKDALKRGKAGHYPALAIEEMPAFIRKLERDDAPMYESTRRAAKLLMLCLTRTRELTEAPKAEFDLEKGIWEIPKERMKMGKPHIVPLSRQAIAIIKAQMAATADLNTKWLFPCQGKPRQPMSDGAVLAAIHRMGYKGRMTGHGFRAVGMSAIKERLGYRHEVVDRQLAHVPGKLDRAYDRARFLEERTKMMQEWADYLDEITRRGEAFTIEKPESDLNALFRKWLARMATEGLTPDEALASPA